MTRKHRLPLSPPNMADPSTKPHSTQNTSFSTDQDFPPTNTAYPDLDADLQMEDDPTRDSQALQDQNASSSTLDHEHTTQNDTQQQQQPTSSSSHGPAPSRKDASLKEFLSKMDDYAPIVRPAITPILHIHHPPACILLLLTLSPPPRSPTQ